MPSWVDEPAVERASVTGVIITIDHFGNLISNIDGPLIERFRLPLVHAGNHAFPLLRTYGDTRPGEYLALINSFGVVEIARAEQSAAEGSGLSRGAPVMVRDERTSREALEGTGEARILLWRESVIVRCLAPCPCGTYPLI